MENDRNGKKRARKRRIAVNTAERGERRNGLNGYGSDGTRTPRRTKPTKPFLDTRSGTKIKVSWDKRSDLRYETT